MSDRGSSNITETDLPEQAVASPKYVDLTAFGGLKKKVEVRAPDGRRAYRSLDELCETTEFRQMMDREFPQAAGEWDDGVSRRNFMKLMGASLALAGLTSAGCGKPEERIVPYVQQPEILVPGKPLFYASAMPWAGYGKGVLVEQHEGRPTKIEGNKDHPSSRGAADVWCQASILTMYDPDRSQVLTRFGNVSSWGAFELALSDALTFQDWNGAKVARRTAPANVRILTETVTSPTIKAQIDGLKKTFPSLVWHKFDAVGRDNTRAGAKAAFGEDVEAVYDFSKAEVVVALDSNFFVDDPGSMRYSNDYLKLRRVRATMPADPDVATTHAEIPGTPAGEAKSRGTASGPRLAPGNRLFAVESTPTLVGSMADHKLRVKPDQVQAFAAALQKAVAAGSAEGATFAGAEKWFAGLVGELLAKKGKSLVVAGEYAAPEVHVLAHAINSALGNVAAAGEEKPVKLIPAVDANPVDSVQSLTELTAAVTAGQVDVLFILGVNPVYTAPADLKFTDLLTNSYVGGKGKLFIAHLGLYEDETARMAEWHVPEAFFLEAWGDVRAHDGTASIIQPLIAPLYPASRSAVEMLAALSDRATVATNHPITTQPATAPAAPSGPATLPGNVPAPTGSGGYEVVRNTWRQLSGKTGGDFETFWTMSLHNGVVENTAAAAKAVTVKPDAVAKAAQPVAAAGGMTLMFRPDPTLWDGAWANNGWLQELPKPLTKLTWDNALLISVKAAKALGLTDVETGNVFKEKFTTALEKTVDVSAGTLSLKGVPVWVMPGHPDGCATLYLGGGRKWAGRVGSPVDAQVGFDAYTLRASASRWFAAATVTPAGGTYKLAVTQNHQVINHELNHKRELVIAGSSIAEVADEYEHELAEREGGKAEEHKDHAGHEAKAEYKYDYDKNLRTARSVGLPILPQDASASSVSLFPENPDNRITPENPGGQDPRYAAWGMVIDQTACMGCNACVVACQAENNIPVVGKAMVMMEREMHWLRIDTYYIGKGVAGDEHGHTDTVDVSDPDATYFQPLPCMQCEKAPCEVVCPVAATVHSKEGLNDMVYNRCVGTRYCSNNCPYKVRRFNFLKYNDDTTPVLKLLRNPEVTVRSRGVMEKCTYCVQRISRGRIEAKKAEVAIVANGGSAADADKAWKGVLGSIQTACAQACPTQAIVFGNMADVQSPVAQLKQEPVGFHYGLLAELNTRPRTSYLARINNPLPGTGESHETNTGTGGVNKEAPGPRGEH
ncbi:MAG: Fe-S-cluster-containing hydrogenase component 1-like protein [Phycisphaerales bacterium]|nr:Fe-S-cluster-containing hydrogenase component 1-like protein [Phycisphaerales bacterium]